MMGEDAREVFGEGAFAPSRLIMFSGGVDSTFLLKQALIETSDDVIAHHVHIVNNEGRHEAEAQACRKIVDYCRANYRPFRYSESLVNRSGFAAAGFDVMTVALEGGIAASNLLLSDGKMPDYWTLGLNAEELASLNKQAGFSGVASGDVRYSDVRLGHVCSVMRASCFPNDPPRYLAPDVRPKRELIAYLGPQLSRLCWTCRRPQKLERGFRPCGTCATCKLMGEIRMVEAS